MDGIVLWMLSELGDLDAFDERFDAKMSYNRLPEPGEGVEAAKKKPPGESLAVPSAKH